MDDAFFVGRREAVRDLDRDLDRLPLREGSVLQARAEALALEELRGGVGAAPVDPEIEDPENVRMVQRRHGLRFALEAGQGAGVGRKSFGQDLDGDLASEPRVLRPVDFAHSAGAKRREDFVRPETGTGGEGHRFASVPQLRTRFRGDEATSPTSVLTRNFCPSADTS